MNIELSRNKRIYLTIALAFIALVPWAPDIFYTIMRLVESAITDNNVLIPIDGRGEYSTWKIYWHMVALAIFLAMLFGTENIVLRSKYAWGIGLFFFWPFVCLFFLNKVLWQEYKNLN